MRLVLRGGQEDLVAPGGQGIDQRLAGEVERGADLAALQDCPGPLVAGAVPVLLVVVALIEERLGELLDHILGDVVTFGLTLRLGVACDQVRIEVGLGATVLVALDSRLPLHLPVQQVDFLVVRSGLRVLQDQLDEPGLGRCLDPLQRGRPVPLITGLPAVEGLFLLAQVIGDIGDAPTHPVQVLGVAAGVGGELGDSIHGADAAGRAREPLPPRPVAGLPTGTARCRSLASCRPCPQRKAHRPQRGIPAWPARPTPPPRSSAPNSSASPLKA
ncbi:hypothetical protein FQZ97_934080 [compost metagenome]